MSRGLSLHIYLGEKLVLTKDCRFRSPSAVAGVIAGTGYGGSIKWKDQGGRTLNENERAAVEEN